jgi:hypothetical protein
MEFSGFAYKALYVTNVDQQIYKRTLTWDKSDPQAPVWSQAFSGDNGKT